MTRLGLRLRIFLFFGLLALGGLAITAGGLWAGYRRAGDPALLPAYLFSFTVIGLLVLALVVAVWLLFDEHVARPIERLASDLRLRAHGGVRAPIDPRPARYLGDLAPAAAALAEQLGDSALRGAEAVARETARLNAEKARLSAVLSDIPVAVILAGTDHRIVLYDAQAAALLATVGPPRLDASLCDYLEPEALAAAHARLARSGREVAFTATTADGATRLAARMKPLEDAPGYLLVLDPPAPEPPPEAARPLVYDFDLLNRPGDRPLPDRALADLAFVVFDTETTGLSPQRDEIVQIGALRVLRGRIVEGERFETLVDPGMPIPPGATRVHGITDAMVAGAPDIARAGRQFHRFAADAVIVAHNAPFDMAFLRRHAARMGVRWDQPILDTVLLSAVLFGTAERHTLDALCERLGLQLPAARRHTAPGDARATAEALCRMLPMLEARGLTRLDQVIGETRRHGRLLKDLN